MFLSKLPVQALNMVSSFPGGQAHVLCDRYPYDPAAVRALK